MSDKIRQSLSQATLDALFPAERTDAFFDALYGGAEDGAYDIRLVFRKADAQSIHLAFELRQRPGKCLVCSLTYGLPQVFQRHPLINVGSIAQKIAYLADWEVDKSAWSLGRTEEMTSALHCIPLVITKG